MEKSRFDLLARLLRSKEPVTTAARLTLVHGLKPADAARTANVSQASLSRSLKSYRDLEAAIQKEF